MNGENENKEAMETMSGEVLTNEQVQASEKLSEITKKINNAMDGMQYGMYDVAGLLFEASKFIKESEYKSLGAYAEANFGIKKARASQLKTVAERFLEKKADENGNEHYECKLTADGRPWTVDALYMLSAKFEDEAINTMIEDKKIKSTMSNKALEEAITPKKAIPQNEADKAKAEAETAKAEAEAVKAEAEAAKAEAETAKAEAEAVKAEAEAAKDIWNEDLFQINQLANFILEVCQKHASSAVAKQIVKSVEEIERLSHAE